MRPLPILLSIALLLGFAPNVPAQASGPYDASSVMFAQMMIPHHQQAVLISKWALKQGNNAAVKKLAARIIAEQGSEIAQMQKWIPGDDMTGMEMHSHMQGIVSAADLSKLKAARGKKFDGLYLVNMTMHHQGAIAMATPLIKSKNSEVAALCKSIISGQSAEISEMRRIMMTGK
jgi:uncharacterized protein (DUF305 family)